MQHHCDLNLTFDVTVPTRMLKSCLGYNLEPIRYSKLILGLFVGGVGVQPFGMTKF